MVGSRRLYGSVKYEMVVAVVGLRLRRIGLSMGTEGCVYGPVVAWLVLEDVRGCSAKFGVAISRFVLLTRRCVSVNLFAHLSSQQNNRSYITFVNENVCPQPQA